MNVLSEDEPVPPRADQSNTAVTSIALNAFALCPYAELTTRAVDGTGVLTKPAVSLGAAGVIRAISFAAGHSVHTSPRLQVGDEVWTRVALSHFGGSPVPLPANQVFSIPLGISLAQAATLGDSAIMAMVALRDANVVAGMRVLVHGAANPFGHAVVALARHLGAKPVATIDHAAERAIAETSGALEVVAARGRGAAEQLLNASRDHGNSAQAHAGFDVIFDAAIAEHMELNIAVLAQNGVIVTCPLRGRIGAIRGVEMLANKNGQIRFATQSAIANHDVFELGLIVNAAIHAGDYRPLVGQVIGPGELDDALGRLARGRAIGNVVLQTDFPAGAAPVLRTYF
jgi:NADPH:quinone reductase-like Zn-dependent oxidoreductase